MIPSFNKFKIEYVVDYNDKMLMLSELANKVRSVCNFGEADKLLVSAQPTPTETVVSIDLMKGKPPPEPFLTIADHQRLTADEAISYLIGIGEGCLFVNTPMQYIKDRIIALKESLKK